MIKFFKSFYKNTSGSIMPAFALLIFPVMVGVGVAIDYTASSRNSSDVSNFADAALLSIAREVSDLIDAKTFDGAKDEIKEMLMPLLAESLSSHKNLNFKIHDVTFDPAAGGLKIDIEVAQDTTFMSIANIDEIKTMVTTGISVGGSLKGPLSIAYVMDKSNSMTGEDKWGAVKSSLDTMNANFQGMDPDKKYIRTALWAYDHETYNFDGFNWGMTEVIASMNSLSPSGWTNSSGAMANAYDSLSLDEENKIHKNKNSGRLQKYIVFLTDGINTAGPFGPSPVVINTATLATCDSAKADGIEIFAIAFGAAANNAAAQMMRDCASGDDNFFAAAEESELEEAFKQISDSTSSDFYLSH